MTKDWKVKQVVVTRLDSGAASSSSVQGVNVAPNAAPKPQQNKLKRMGTSKMHKFNPPVTLDQALAWLSEYGNADSSVVFENNCCLLFEHGTFYEFENLLDSDSDED